MTRFRLIIFTALAASTALLGACDFSIEDSTRLERAQQAIENEEFRVAGIELKNILRSDPANIKARILLGEVSLEAGDPATAAKELQRAKELGAQDDDYIVSLGKALLAINKPDEVLALEVDDLQDDDEKANLIALHGNAHLLKREFDNASIQFRRTLSRVPDHVEALVGVARINLEKGDTEAAENALRQVIALNRDAHIAHAALARLKLNATEYAEAERSFRRAIELTDFKSKRREQITYMAGLVDTLLLQRKLEAAQDVSNNMLTLAPEHPFALFQAGRADFESGRHDDAIEKAQRVISAYPQYQPARLLLAAAAMSKANFALAEVHLSSLLSDNPGNEMARKLMAQTQIGLGSPEEALNILGPLLDREFVDPDTLAMAGSAGISSGQTEAGLKYLSKSVQTSGLTDAAKLRAANSFIAAGKPAMAIELLTQMDDGVQPASQRDSLLLLARLRNGEVELARVEAQKILDKYPNDAASHKLMGSFYLSTDDHEQARRYLQNASKLEPDDLSAIVSLARLDVLAGDLQSAEKRYRDMLAYAPNSVFALMGLSQLAEKKGNYSEAIELLETARQIEPTALQPLLYLSRFYLRLDKLDLAAERANQAMDIAPDTAEALSAVGLVQLAKDRYSEAALTFERALFLAPNQVQPRFYLAQAQLKMGMNEAARKSLATTLNLDPTHLRARLAIARLDSLLGNYDEAVSMATELHQDFPAIAEPLVLRGDVQFARGRFNDAIASYDLAAAIMPDEKKLAIKRYQVRYRAGLADAHEVIEQWAEKHPADKEIDLVLAQAYQAAGLQNRAISQYQKILAADENNVVALNNLAWLYAEIGGEENLQLGARISERAHRALPDVGEITDTYGWLLLIQGKVEEATRILRKAMQQSPDDPEIRYHLAVALQRSGSATEARDLLDEILDGQSGAGNLEKARELREKL